MLVITDRRLLDKQIRDTIRQFAQVGATVGPAHSANQLRTLLEDGKRIIISTVQKFPFILDAIGDEHRGRNFAIIIDEAHSSQGGRTATAMAMALGEAGAGAEDDEEETVEDVINRLMESKKLLWQRQLLRLYGHAQEQGRSRSSERPYPRAARSGTGPSMFTQ